MKTPHNSLSSNALTQNCHTATGAKIKRVLGGRSRPAVVDEAAEWLGASVTTFQIHGWRYSKPMWIDDGPCLVVHRSPDLVFAGDAFAGARVEGAALSGLAAADAILAGLP